MIYKPAFIGEDTDKVFYDFNKAIDNLKAAIIEQHPYFKFARWVYSKIESIFP